MGFNGQLFSYHGECDLMLMQSRKHGVTVHIRTTRIDHPLISFSFISNAAIKVADNILEVSDDGSLFVNGNDASESDMMFLPSAFDGFKLIRTTKGTKSNILAYMLDLGQDRFVEIRCNKKTGMLFIDVGGTFSDSEGLLGNSVEIIIRSFYKLFIIMINTEILPIVIIAFFVHLLNQELFQMPSSVYRRFIT